MDNIKLWKKEKDDRLLFESLFTLRFEKFYDKNEYRSLIDFQKTNFSVFEKLLEGTRHFFSHYFRDDEDILLEPSEIKLIDNLKVLAKQIAVEKNNDLSLNEEFELHKDLKLTIAGAIFITCIALTKKDAFVFLSQNVGFKDSRTEKKYRRLFFTALCLRDNNKKNKLIFTEKKDWLQGSIMAELNRIPYPIYHSQSKAQKEKIDERLEKQMYDDNDELIIQEDKIQLRKSDRFMQLSLLYLDMYVLDDIFLFPFHSDKNRHEINGIGDKYIYERNKYRVGNEWYKLSDENRVVLKITDNNDVKNIHFIHLTRNNIYELLLLHFGLSRKADVNDVLKSYIKSFKYENSEIAKSHNYENRRNEAIMKIDLKIKEFQDKKPSYFEINSNILYYLQRFLAIKNGSVEAIDLFNLKEYDFLRECLINYKRPEQREKFWKFIEEKNLEQFYKLSSLKEINDIDLFYNKLLLMIKKYYQSLNEKSLATIFYIKPTPNQVNEKQVHFNSIQNNFSIEDGALIQRVDPNCKKSKLLFEFTNEKLSIKGKNRLELDKNVHWNQDFGELYFSKLTLPYHIKAYHRLHEKIKKYYSDKEQRRKYNRLKSEVVNYCIQDAFLLNILYVLDKSIYNINTQINFYEYYKKQNYTVNLKYGTQIIEMNLKDTQKYISVFNPKIIKCYYEQDDKNYFPKNLDGLKQIKQKYIQKQQLIIRHWMQMEKTLVLKYKRELIQERIKDGAHLPKGDFLRLLKIDSKINEDTSHVDNIQDWHELRNKALHNDVSQKWFDDQIVSQFINRI